MVGDKWYLISDLQAMTQRPARHRHGRAVDMSGNIVNVWD